MIIFYSGTPGRPLPEELVSKADILISFEYCCKRNGSDYKRLQRLIEERKKWKLIG